MADAQLVDGPVEQAVDGNPTLTLLRARYAPWILPLLSAHLEFSDGPVSADWFHEKVAEARSRQEDLPGDVKPADLCRTWRDKGWLITITGPDGRTRYQLSDHSLRAIRYVREIIEGESSVTGARLGSIAHAIRLLADMTNPEREAQVARIDEQIRELERRKQDIAAGRTRLATTEEMRLQLREVMAMTASLPADFRKLRSMVEQRHQEVARLAMEEGPTKAELVERYLQEHDLLSETSQGRAYRGFAQMLSSRQADAIRDDVEQILGQDFAQTHMSDQQRGQLESMLSMLMHEELAVQEGYVRWTASLRRHLTRTAHGRHSRLLTMADRALNAGIRWAQTGSGPRTITNVLGVAPAAIVDISQTQLWRDRGSQTVEVVAEPNTSALPEEDRAALRLAAGLSTKAATRTINDLLQTRQLVTGTEAYEATPPEFQRLGTLLSLLDLAVQHGEVDIELEERVSMTSAGGQRVWITLPYLLFHEPLATSQAGPAAARGR